MSDVARQYELVAVVLAGAMLASTVVGSQVRGAGRVPAFLLTVALGAAFLAALLIAVVSQ